MVHNNYRFDRLSYDGCKAHSTLVGIILFVCIGVFALIVALVICLTNVTKSAVNKHQMKQQADNLLYS